MQRSEASQNSLYRSESYGCPRGRGQGSAVSITTATPVAPTLTGLDRPCEVAALRRRVARLGDARADDDVGKLESFMFGAIAIESSSANSSGRSFTCLRRIASGIGGPLAARAKTNTVSVGATFAASAGARLTLPATCAGSGGLGLGRLCRRGRAPAELARLGDARLDRLRRSAARGRDRLSRSQ